jgi:Uma2 family endonuclease
MGISTPGEPVSIEEYLSNPAFEHSEYVNGEVMPLNMGTKSHSKIHVKCRAILQDYLKRNPIGFAGAELRCRLRIGNGLHYRLPDIAVVPIDPSPDSPYLEGAPDMVVEIKSPEDKITPLFDKLEEYFANGTKLAWIVLPEEESVLSTPDTHPRTFGLGATLDGATLLPELSVPVKELFS